MTLPGIHSTVKIRVPAPRDGRRINTGVRRIKNDELMIRSAAERSSWSLTAAIMLC